MACQVRLREVSLKAKPQALLDLGSPSTVPQLIDERGNRISESWDIMQWAIRNAKNTSLVEQLWPASKRAQSRILAWKNYNDGQFKYWLDRYKYADRYPEQDELFYRNKGEVFLKRLNNRLSKSNYIICNEMTLADVAVFPFIRQFSSVNKDWFANSDYEYVKRWLNSFIEEDGFNNQIMKKLPFWAKWSRRYFVSILPKWHLNS